MMTAFDAAATALARPPHWLYLAYPRLRGTSAPPRGTAFRQVVPNLDAANQLAAAARAAARVRRADAAFVVAAAASHGFGARLSGRPYGCWVATALADEWDPRRRQLPRSRRLALGISAPALRAMERSVLRQARVLWAISDATRRGLAGAAGIDEERIRVVPIPLDLDGLTPLPDAEWAGRTEILFLGRASDPRKNVRLLLEALPLIRAELPEATLRLVGEPPPGALPEGATAVGMVTAIAPELRRASLLVLPSLQEGFGMVVAEAFACGVPVVVTPSGGPEATVRASGAGEVLSGFTPNELAATVVRLLRDPARLLELRHRGRAYVERTHAPAQLEQALAEALAVLEGR
jgi:glycosyltransferase involved in cell wall biosynthesis